MKINAAKFYTSLFVIVVLSQLYLSSFKANIFLQFIFLGLFFFLEKVKISKTFLKLVLPLMILFLLGFLGAIFNKYILFNIVKDIFHFIKPLLGILIGYFFYKKTNNFKLFVKTIILIGFISAIIHFIIIFFFSNIESISGIRSLGRDNFLELFALFFLGYYKRYQKETLFDNRLRHNIIFYGLLISNVLYFSRTMIIVAIILLVSLHGYSIITKKTLKIIGFLLIAFISFYIYLFSIKIDRSKPGLEAFLYKIKIAPSEIFETKIDRENHKDLWDHWRGYEAKRTFALMQENPSSFVFCCGFGSLVNLRFYAPLTGDKKGMRYISELHNGYVYVFYKTGIIGLIIYLFFLLRLYIKIYVVKNLVGVFVSAIGLTFLFTTLTITGIYNPRDVIVFILGALLFFEANNQKELT